MDGTTLKPVVTLSFFSLLVVLVGSPSGPAGAASEPTASAKRRSASRAAT